MNQTTSVPRATKPSDSATMSSVTSSHRLSARKSGHRSAATPASISNTPSVRPASQPLRRSLPSQQTSRASPASSRQPSTGHVSSQLASAWPFNPQETELIRAGYRPAFKPKPVAAADEQSSTNNNSNRKGPNKKKNMAEPRARAARHKGQMNFASERTSVAVDSRSIARSIVLVANMNTHISPPPPSCLW